MKKIKIFVRAFKTKDGREFTKATIQGKYLPLVEALENEYYQVKFVGDVKEPTREGSYLVGYEKNGLWIDSRLEYVKKHIVRVRATKVVFDEKLPTKNDENELE